MGNRLYVGNLSYNTSREDLESLFAAHGTVEKVDLIVDRDTGQSKGFGFIQMASDQEAQAAIAGLNEKEIDGRKLTVNEARPREERPRSGGGGYGGGGKGRGDRGGYGGGRKSY